MSVKVFMIGYKLMPWTDGVGDSDGLNSRLGVLVKHQYANEGHQSEPQIRVGPWWNWIT